jgi:hypothetical protein
MIRTSGRTESRREGRGVVVLFLYASLHIPGTGGAETHHCIHRAVGKSNYHDDATIGFEHSDLHFCKSMLLLSPILLVAVTVRCLNGVNKPPRDALFSDKRFVQLAGGDLTLYVVYVHGTSSSVQAGGGVRTSGRQKNEQKAKEQLL